MSPMVQSTTARLSILWENKLKLERNQTEKERDTERKRERERNQKKIHLGAGGINRSVSQMNASKYLRDEIAA